MYTMKLFNICSLNEKRYLSLLYYKFYYTDL